MSEACPGISASVLSRIATWHIREETYTKALAEIVNHHHQIDLAGHWGDGTTSSSDGQRFPTGGRGDARGQLNARYGTDPGVTFYTHVSDLAQLADAARQVDKAAFGSTADLPKNHQRRRACAELSYFHFSSASSAHQLQHRLTNR